MTDTPSMIDQSPNDEERSQLPQTWDELKQRPEFTGIPDLKQPQTFTIEDSAMFELTRSRVNTNLRKLSDMGVFDPSRQAGVDEDEVTILLGESASVMGTMLKKLAVDNAAWESWTMGRSVIDSFNLFLTLFGFIGEQLGKSSSSKMNTTPTGSN